MHTKNNRQSASVFGFNFGVVSTTHIVLYVCILPFKSHRTNTELVAGGHFVLGSAEFNSSWSRL